jgi:D-alanine-D-alanine ligase
MPYTGCGVLGSALGMDKYRCKLLWQGAGLATPASVLMRDQRDLTAAAALGFPLMIKPVHEGSSIGMARADDQAQLLDAWRSAAAYDSQILAERWIGGEEYTCAVLGDQALPIIRVETPHEFYDYQAKYASDTTLYHCPSGLSPARESAMRQLALDAFAAVGASGWGRVDILTDEQDQAWLLEINTVPGMTDHSLVPMAAKAAGMDFDELVWRILQSSMEG